MRCPLFSGQERGGNGSGGDERPRSLESRIGQAVRIARTGASATFGSMSAEPVLTHVVAHPVLVSRQDASQAEQCAPDCKTTLHSVIGTFDGADGAAAKATIGM